MAKKDTDKILAAKLASGLFATHSPEGDEEAKASHQKRQQEMAEKASREITLTFLGGNLAHYKEYGVKEVNCQVNSEAHWRKMIEKAKINAQKAGKKLTVINPQRDSNPYENGCPKEEYDYRS